MRAADLTALVNASRELLNAEDAVGAERLLTPLLPRLGSDPEALHLMGLIKRKQAKLSEAERFFRSAISHSFSEGGYYNDLAVLLQGRGEHDEALRLYRAALALTPGAAATRVNIVHCLMAKNDLAEAERETRAFIEATQSPEAWTLLGQVQRAQERHEDALASAHTALKMAPRVRGFQLNYAMSLDRVGRGKEALGHYAKLAGEALDSVELAHHFARTLYADDKKEDAEAVLQQGVKLYPSSAILHAALARVRALRGDGENATAFLEAEMARRPNDLNLRLTCADALHRSDHHQKALAVLNDALKIAPDTPALLNAMGIVLDELNRPLDALKVLRRVTALAPESRIAERNLLSTLIRAGQPEEALQIIRELRADDPDEQYLIAAQALALRVLGDPSYQHFCDYERFVRVYDIPAPRGFFTAQNFNTSLAEVLRHQHKINAHPLDQYLPHGSQTSRNLLVLEEPTITAFRASVESAVRDFIGRFKPDDPVGRRRRERYRFSTMWSVRLTHQGYQPNHVHDRGWISSAYFVSVLPYEKRTDPHAGWLKLGEPNRPIAGCTPERFIEPEPGKLVLFPSYFWHGTVPFEGSERLSAAFDVIPS